MMKNAKIRIQLKLDFSISHNHLVTAEEKQVIDLCKVSFFLNHVDTLTKSMNHLK